MNQKWMLQYLKITCIRHVLIIVLQVILIKSRVIALINNSLSVIESKQNY